MSSVKSRLPRIVFAIFRQCHSTHLYVHKPHYQLAFFSITFQDFVYEYFFCFIQIHVFDHGFYHRWGNILVSYRITLIGALCNFSSTVMSFYFSSPGRITESRSIKVNMSLEFLLMEIRMTSIHGFALFTYKFRHILF